MKLGHTITVHHNPPFINTSQTQPFLIAVYLLRSQVQGFFDIENRNEARVLRGLRTHAARFELGDFLFELREASSL